MPEVKVPQETGEITVNHAGESKTRQVSDHIVEVAAADLDLFLTVVDGAELVEAKKKSKSE